MCVISLDTILTLLHLSTAPKLPGSISFPFLCWWREEKDQFIVFCINEIWLYFPFLSASLFVFCFFEALCHQSGRWNEQWHISPRMLEMISRRGKVLQKALIRLLIAFKWICLIVSVRTRSSVALFPHNNRLQWNIKWWCIGTVWWLTAWPCAGVRELPQGFSLLRRQSSLNPGVSHQQLTH